MTCPVHAVETPDTKAYVLFLLLIINYVFHLDRYPDPWLRTYLDTNSILHLRLLVDYIVFRSIRTRADSDILENVFSVDQNIMISRYLSTTARQSRRVCDPIARAGPTNVTAVSNRYVRDEKIKRKGPKVETLYGAVNDARRRLFSFFGTAYAYVSQRRTLLLDENSKKHIRYQPR